MFILNRSLTEIKPEEKSGDARGLFFMDFGNTYGIQDEDFYV